MSRTGAREVSVLWEQRRDYRPDTGGDSAYQEHQSVGQRPERRAIQRRGEQRQRHKAVWLASHKGKPEHSFTVLSRLAGVPTGVKRPCER